MSSLSKGTSWVKRIGNAVRRKQAPKAEASEKGSKLKDKASSKLKAGGTVTGGTNLNKQTAGNTMPAAGKATGSSGKLNVAGKK